MSEQVWTHDWSKPDANGKLLPYAKVFDSCGIRLGAVVRCNVNTGAAHIASDEVLGSVDRMIYPAPLRVEFEQ